MSNGNDRIKEIRRLATIAAEAIDADVVILNGPMYEGFAEHLNDVLQALTIARPSVYLILATNGGDAHAAYMISRCLQRRYAKVTICVVLGATERLLETYPSHSCVIDREEAKELFTNVREASDEEWALLELIGSVARIAEDDSDSALALVLSEEVKQPEDHTNGQQPDTKQPGAGASKKTVEPAAGDGSAQGEAHSGAAARGNGKTDEGGQGAI